MDDTMGFFTTGRSNDYKNLDRLHPLLDFIEPILKLYSSNLVDYSIDENNFVVDFSKMINTFENSLKNAKNMFQLVRSHVTEKEILETIEKKIQEVEEYMDKYIRGKYYFNETSKPQYSVIDYSEYKNSEYKALQLLTRQRTPVDVDFALSLQSLVELDDNTIKSEFYSNVVTLMHTDIISPPSRGMLSCNGKGTYPCLESLTRYPKTFMHSKIIKKSLLSRNVTSGSLLQSFNNLLCHYLESTFDMGNGVIYRKIFEPFINEAYSGVMNGMGFLDSSPFLIAHAELLNFTKREPISASLAYSIKRLYSEKQEKGEAFKWVKDDVNVLPEFYKEKLRRDLVYFVNLFKTFIDRATMLREIASVSSINVVLRTCPLQEILELTNDAPPTKPEDIDVDSNEIVKELKNENNLRTKSELLARLSIFENSDQESPQLAFKELVDNEKLYFKYCLNKKPTSGRPNPAADFKTNPTTAGVRPNIVFAFQSLNEVISDYKIPYPVFNKDNQNFEDFRVGSYKETMPINYINMYKGSDELKLRNVQDYRNYYLAVVDKFIKYTTALINGAELTLRDLDSTNTIGDISKNFITDYKTRNRMPPIIVPSYFKKVTLNRFIDRPMFSENDDPGSNEFKLTYGFRNMISEGGKKDKSAFEYLLTRVNSSLSQQINPQMYSSLLDQQITLQSYLYSVLNDKNAFSFLDMDLYGKFTNEEKTDANQLIYQIESSNQKAVMRQLCANNSKTKIITDRGMAIKVNILDMNISPVNLKALTRSVPFANLFNYSFTCNEVLKDSAHFKKIVEFLDKDEEVLINNKDILNFLLSNEDGYGRPKFLTDQLYAKAAFGSITEGGSPD
jgi:hypothetical protein